LSSRLGVIGAPTKVDTQHAAGDDGGENYGGEPFGNVYGIVVAQLDNDNAMESVVVVLTDE
jgi:hypothetical protein